MKKYIYTILLLSILGVVLSISMLIQHFYPDINLGALSCGTDLESACLTASHSEFGQFFLMPLAGYGVFFYLIIIFTVLIAEDAKAVYYQIACSIVLPLVIFSLIIDLVLFIILVGMNTFCEFCIATYIINICLTIAASLWYKGIKKAESTNLISIYKNIILKRNESPHKKAAYASYILFVIIMFFSIFLTSHILELKATERSARSQQLQGYIDEFYSIKQEEIDLPDNGLLFGNPNASVSITVFSDYLCSACYEFYKIENKLLEKYGDAINFINYIYPLDKECNENMDETIYPNSCLASRAVLASNISGRVNDYVKFHFSSYKSYYKKIEGYDVMDYTVEQALKNFKLLKIPGTDGTAFLESIKSNKVNQILRDHVKAADLYKIDATPTIFIGKRRLVGAPPIEVLDKIISIELYRSK